MMKTTFKTVRKTLAFTLAIVFILSMIPFGMVMAFDSTGTDLEIKDTGGNALSSVPTLSPGQVWTGRSVTDNGDGTFTVTLVAAGASYGEDNSKKPLKSALIINDEFNAEDFDISITSCDVGSYELVSGGKVVEWTIDADDLFGGTVNTLVYMLTLTGREPNVTYNTHEEDSGNARFTVTDDNPYYWTNTPVPFEIIAGIEGPNWNNGKTWKNGSSATNNTQASIRWFTLLEQQDGKMVAIQPRFETPLNEQNDLLDLDGSIFDQELAKNQKNNFYVINNVTIFDSPSYLKTYYITAAVYDAVNNRYEVYRGTIAVDGPGGNANITTHFTKEIIYVDKWNPVPGSGNNGDGKIEHNLDNSSWVELKKMDGGITVSKKAARFVANPDENEAPFAHIKNRSYKDSITVNYGDLVVFKITVSNSWNTSRTISLEDILSGDGVNEDLSNGLVYADGSKVGSNEIKVDGKSSVTLYYVWDAVTDASIVTNAVQVTDTIDEDDNDNDNTTVKIRQPGISVVKEAISTSAKVDGYGIGEKIVYEIVITNTGRVTLYNVEWNDVLSGISGPFASEADAYAGTPISADLSNGNGNLSLAPRQSLSVFYTYTVTSADNDKIILPNSVTVKGTSGGKTVEDEDDKTVDLALLHELEFNKEVINAPEGSDYSDGETAFYRITVENKGNATAHGVNVVDEYAEYQYVSPNNGDINPKNFDIAPGVTYEFYFSMKLVGMTLEEALVLHENAIAQAEENVKTAGANVNTYYDAIADVEKNIKDIEDAYADAVALYAESDENAELTPELVAYYQDALNNLNTQKQDFQEELAVALSEQLYAANELANLKAYEPSKDAEEICNIAYLTYNYTVTPSVPVIVNVQPQVVTLLDISKQVRISGEDNWDHSAILPPGGGYVDYLITINNYGTTPVEVTLKDLFNDATLSDFDDANTTITVPVGNYPIHIDGFHIVRDDDNIYEDSAKFTNRITMTYYEGEKEIELSDNAVVIVPKTPYDKLGITKSVMTEDGAWARELSVSSDTDVTVTYKVTIENLGTKATKFSLIDELYEKSADFKGYYTAEGNRIEADEDGLYTIASGATMEFYYQMTIKADYSESATVEVTNVAAYVIDNGTIRPEDKDEDSSDATVVVTPTQKSAILLVEKKVVTRDVYDEYEDNVEDIPWKDSAEIANYGGIGEFVFGITIYNDGDTGVKVALSDVMTDEELNVYGLEDVDGNYYIPAGESISVPGFAILTTGEYVNVATIVVTDTTPGLIVTIDEGNDTDSATAIVTKIPPDIVPINLSIDKKVSIDNRVTWNDSVTTSPTNAPVSAVYRITLSIEEALDFAVYATVSDFLNGSEVNLIPEESRDVVIPAGSTNSEPIYIEVTLPAGAATHTNVARIVEYWIDENEAVDPYFTVDDESSAVVTITVPGTVPIITEETGGDTTVTTTTTPTPDPEPVVADVVEEQTPLADVPEIDVPLAALPPDPEEFMDVIIDDPDVPLSTLPQTGRNELLPLGILGIGAVALAGGILLNGKKKQDEDMI